MKKALALLLCLLILATMVVGCGQTPQPTTTASATVAATATTTTTAAETTAATETTVPATSEPVEIVMERPLWGDGNPDSDYSKAIQAAILKALNIKVTIVGEANPSDQAQKPNLMLAAGEQLDIFQVGPDNIKGWRKYKNDGVIIPLNDLLESNGQDLKAKTDPHSWIELTDPDGKIWSLADEQPGVTTDMFIRQDWLDTAGLKVPKTIAEYESVMEAFKTKFKDVGFVPLWPDAEESVFLGSFVEHVTIYKDDAGKLQPVWFQTGYKDYLAKMADWYKKGYLNKEISTMDYNTAQGLMWAGQTGIMMNWMSLYGLPSNEVLIIKNVPSAKVSPLAPPVGAFPGKVGGGGTVSANVMITTSCKNPQAAMTFLNWSMATDEGWALCKFGIEGTDYTVVDAAKHLIKLADNPPYAIYCSTRLNAMQGNLLMDVSGVASNDFYQNPSTYPVEYPILLGFVPDQAKIQPFQDKLQPLDQQLNELRQKIIMGEEPVSKWDDMVKSYMDKGGRAYYDEMTTQFVK